MIENISTRELAVELAKRKNLVSLVNCDGSVDPEIYPLRAILGAVGTADSIAVRMEDGKIYGAVIKRKTGRFPNKLALIGGVVYRYEALEDAVKRHWKQDLGLHISLPLGWDHPVCMRQYAPQINGVNRSGFCHDPGKHSYASTHLVIINGDYTKTSFGTKIGGQEASALLWYAEETAPDEGEWSYDMRSTFLELLRTAKQLVAGGELRL